MVRLGALAFALCALAVCALTAPLAAQGIAWKNEFVFYGDNTEFFTPYREGETILGGQFKSYLSFTPGPRTTVIAGVFGDRRSGDADFLPTVKPLLSFQYHTDHSTGVLGTLITERRHGLIEPLEVTTLELTRPIEYGFQWIERRRGFGAEVYLNWQHLNTETSREIFDYGLILSASPANHVTLEAQLHGLHHGGQLYDAGVPVTNNGAGGIGVTLSDTVRALGPSRLTVFQLWSGGDIDPNAPADRPDKGHGTYVRASAKPMRDFEVFGIWWRGRDFVSSEGDNNYNSLGKDSLFFRSKRKYLELGVLRRTTIENGVTLDAEFRLHRIDDEQSIALWDTSWEYSYRLVIRAPIEVIFRK